VFSDRSNITEIRNFKNVEWRVKTPCHGIVKVEDWVRERRSEYFSEHTNQGKNPLLRFESFYSDEI